MKLILHVGSHKTGTTSIQTALAENRHWLQERNFTYPKLSETSSSHNELAHVLAVAPADEVDGIRRLIRQSAKPNSSMILSAEEFSARIVGNRQWHGLGGSDYWPKRIEYLQRLKYCLQDFDDIRVFFCLRKADDFAESLYATKALSTKTGFAGSFEDFLIDAAGNFEYAQHCASFAKFFPNINVRGFDELVGDLLPTFFQWTSIPMPPVITPAKKITPSLKLVSWLNKWRKRALIRDLDNDSLAKKFIKSGAASLIYQHAGKATLWKDEDYRLAFIAKTEAGFPSSFFQRSAVRMRVPAELDEADYDFITRSFEGWLNNKNLKKHKS